MRERENRLAMRATGRPKGGQKGKKGRKTSRVEDTIMVQWTQQCGGVLLYRVDASDGRFLRYRHIRIKRTNTLCTISRYSSAALCSSYVFVRALRYGFAVASQLNNFDHVTLPHSHARLLRPHLHRPSYDSSSFPFKFPCHTSNQVTKDSRTAQNSTADATSARLLDSRHSNVTYDVHDNSLFESVLGSSFFVRHLCCL